MQVKKTKEKSLNHFSITWTLYCVSPKTLFILITHFVLQNWTSSAVSKSSITDWRFIYLSNRRDASRKNNTILLLEGWHNVTTLLSLSLQCKEKNIYPCKHTSKKTKEFHVGLKTMKEWKGHVGEGDKLGVGWLWEVRLENSEEESWSWGFFASLMWSIIHYT